MNGDDERDYAEEADVRREAEREGLAELEAERAELRALDDPQHREDPAVVGYDVAAYEAAGVARVEQAQKEDCCEDNGCRCHFAVRYDEDGFETGDEDDLDDCEHCPNHCGCTPCCYARVA